MTTYATNITTPAAAIVTALATASSNAATLHTNLSAAGFPGITLNNLATSTTSWRSDVGDMRNALDSAMSDLSVAAQKFAAISSLLASIGGLD